MSHKAPPMSSHEDFKKLTLKLNAPKKAKNTTKTANDDLVENPARDRRPRPSTNTPSICGKHKQKN